MRARPSTGVSAAQARNGSSAADSGQPKAASVTRTPTGTSTATKAGVIVWAKKYSISSTS